MVVDDRYERFQMNFASDFIAKRICGAFEY